MRKAPLALLCSALTLSTTACEKGLAYGDPHEVIVAAPLEWWPQLEDTVFAVLGPDVYTLRTERTFQLSYQDPADESWPLRKMFREEVVIGSEQDGFMADVLAALDDTVTYTVPGIVQADEVWARNQKVTALLVDPAGDVQEQVFSLIGQVHAILDQRFREGAEYRMFVSGRKESLRDSLAQHAGFSLLLPEVYRWGVEDSVYVFRNDNPSPGELIRQFGVTWRTPIPEELPVDSLLDWKETLSEEYYAYPQWVDRESVVTRRLSLGGVEVLELRGGWENPPGDTWPAAGPFILWSLTCPSQDRHYIIDAWLYAPEKDKWEYILQLETILGSFRCPDMGSMTGEGT